MKVTIKSFDVGMEVKRNGVELEVKSPNGADHHGNCHVTMTGLIWCNGRTRKVNGTKVSWAQLEEICASKEKLKAALAAAKNA